MPLCIGDILSSFYFFLLFICLLRFGGGVQDDSSMLLETRGGGREKSIQDHPWLYKKYENNMSTRSPSQGGGGEMTNNPIHFIT